MGQLDTVMLLDTLFNGGDLHGGAGCTIILSTLFTLSAGAKVCHSNIEMLSMELCAFSNPSKYCEESKFNAVNVLLYQTSPPTLTLH